MAKSYQWTDLKVCIWKIFYSFVTEDHLNMSAVSCPQDWTVQKRRDNSLIIYPWIFTQFDIFSSSSILNRILLSLLTLFSCTFRKKYKFIVALFILSSLLSFSSGRFSPFKRTSFINSSAQKKRTHSDWGKKNQKKDNFDCEHLWNQWHFGISTILWFAINQIWRQQLIYDLFFTRISSRRMKNPQKSSFCDFSTREGAWNESCLELARVTSKLS